MHVIPKWRNSFNLISLLFSAASFSETFYGLKRITVDNSELKEELSSKQRLLSLLLLVLVPYLKQKLARLSMRYQLEEADGYVPQKASTVQKF